MAAVTKEEKVSQPSDHENVAHQPENTTVAASAAQVSEKQTQPGTARGVVLVSTEMYREGLG